MAVSPDGRFVASGSWDRSVRLWDGESGRSIREIAGHEGSVNAVAFTPDGRWLVSAGYDGVIWFWPLKDSDEPVRFAAAGFPINDLAISDDGTLVVAASADETVRLFAVADRRLVRELKGHKGAVLAVALSADGTTIASGGTDGQLLLWDTGTEPRRRLPIQHHRAVWSIAFSPNGEVVYAGGIDRIARAWFVDDGRPLLGATTQFQMVARADRTAADSADPVERGSFHFRKCAICHSLEEDGVPRAGPSLEGLFGRRAGTYPGYRYSDALTRSDLVWNETTVSQLFELGPDVLLPGTKMPLQRLPSDQARRDLIAFLREKTTR